MVHLLFITCSQIGVLHISPLQSSEITISVDDVSGSSGKLENRDTQYAGACMILTKSQGRPATVSGDLTMLQLWCILNWPRAYFGDKERGQKRTKQTINYYSIIGQGFNEAGGCSLVHFCQPESLTWVAQSKHVLISISLHIQHCPSLQIEEFLLGSNFPVMTDPYPFLRCIITHNWQSNILFLRPLNHYN